VHAGVDFFAAIAIRFEPVTGFEQLDLGGVLRLGGSRSLRAGFFGWLLWSLLRLSESKNDVGKQTSECECAQIRMDAWMESQDGLGGSLGRGHECVKIWLRTRSRICTAE
jgi:hypothetical protein